MHFYNVVYFNAPAKLIVIKSNSDKYQMFKCFKTEQCSVLQTSDSKLPQEFSLLDGIYLSSVKVSMQNLNFSFFYIQLLSLRVCYSFLIHMAGSCALVCFLQFVWILFSLTHCRKAASPRSGYTFENVDLGFAACLCTINS